MHFALERALSFPNVSEIVGIKMAMRFARQGAQFAKVSNPSMFISLERTSARESCVKFILCKSL